MALPIPPVSPAPSPPNLEDNGYVKATVFAIIRAVRSLFAAIASLFCSVKRAERPVLPHVAPISPASAAEELLKNRVQGQMTETEILDLFRTTLKITPQERNALYVQLTDGERMQMSPVVRWSTGCIQGNAQEHRVARGKQIAESTPMLLVPYLKTKIK